MREYVKHRQLIEEMYGNVIIVIVVSDEKKMKNTISTSCTATTTIKAISFEAVRVCGTGGAELQRNCWLTEFYLL